MNSSFSLDIDPHGIGRLVFNLPNEKVNKFSRPVLEELSHILDDLYKQDLKALVITSAKENIFIAGADLHEFENAFEEPGITEEIITMGHHLFSKLEALPYPTIAVIHGACLGGGLEFALACTYRIVSDHPKTILGLPEVTLGIIPGWGGTQRLPRLVGLSESLPLILSGKPIPAYKAWKIKLADAIVPWEFLENQVKEFLKSILNEEGKKKMLARREESGARTLLLEKNPLGRKFLFQKAKSSILKKTKGHYPAPLVVLDLIKATHSLPLQDGLKEEAKTFIENVDKAFACSKHLIHLFFVREELKKDPGVAFEGSPKKIESSGVIGSGTMGAGIAWLMSYKDIPVRLKDINWEVIGKGYGAAYAIYGQLIQRNKLKPAQASFKFHNISGAVDYSGFEHLDLIIEAAVEDMALKRKIFHEIESVASPKALIASNTSSLSITEMAKEMQSPERFVGMHFFNPANRMPLVEVVRGEHTSPETVAKAVAICKKLGKIPIVVKDCPGFLVNRIFARGQNAALRLLEEGVEMEQLEKAMLAFGMPMGPCTLSDTVGNDIGYKVGTSLESAYGDRMQVPAIAKAMYDNKLFGKKTRKGFFVYSGKSKKPNPEIQAFLPDHKISLSNDEIVERILKEMVDEAERCLEEQVVTNPDYLDMALVLGIGFPPFRGGLMRYEHERMSKVVV